MLYTNGIDSLHKVAPSTDLAPLAWVFDELRQSLDAANQAIKRFVRESERTTLSALETVDIAALHMARQRLHQAVGALELVGLQGAAQVLRAMESAAQRFIQRPSACNENAALKMEHASFALIEYLDTALNNRPLQPVSLFPQYREIQELATADRVHPADLWSFDPRDLNISPPSNAPLLALDVELRGLFDRLVLQLVRTRDTAAAQQLASLSASLSAIAGQPRAQTFWRVAAAYFEALEHECLPDDVYVKRATSRILLQFASFVQDQNQISETLLRDLLFFCSQTGPIAPDSTLHLSAVRHAFGLESAQPVNYHLALLGSYDPRILREARKYIAAAKESWSLYCGGDESRAAQVVEQFGVVGQSLLKLHPHSGELAAALLEAAKQTTAEGTEVRPDLAMDVATTILYLEASFDRFDANNAELTARTQALAQRLKHTLSGEPAQALEVWMEQLYRDMSDRQTLGSVVNELKLALGDVEKSLDHFFRTQTDTDCLHTAQDKLTQMRGVLSVLGLDQAVQAVNHMRATVDQLLSPLPPLATDGTAGTFERLGSNLSALGLLVDMLNYQPTLARQLFVFDKENAELLPIMGRTQNSPPSASSPAVHSTPTDNSGHTPACHPTPAPVTHSQPQAAPAVTPANVITSTPSQPDCSQIFTAATPVQQTASTAPSHEEDDDELLEIFLQEATEVIEQGTQAVHRLEKQPAELEQLTALRRAFHTLKGSSRMVGLNEFGQAAWAMEQVLNAALAEQSPAHPDVLRLSAQALPALSRWVEHIASRPSQMHFRADPFIASSQAWRDQAQYLAIASPSELVAAHSPASPLDIASLESLASDTAPLAPASSILESDWAAIEIAIDTEEPITHQLADSRPSPHFLLPEEAPGISASEHHIETQADDLAQSTPLLCTATPKISIATDPSPSNPPEHERILPPATAFFEAVDFGHLAGWPNPNTVPVESETIAPEIAVEPFNEREGEPYPPTPAIADPTDPSFAADFELPNLAEQGNPVPSDSANTSPVMTTCATDDEPSDPLSQAAIAPPLHTIESAHHTAIAAAVSSQAVLSEPIASDVATIGPADSEQSAKPEPQSQELPDEQVRVIGNLRIGTNLYNVYLNEADEWSRRLSTELAEWALERHRPVPPLAEGLAHSLAGSSATMGFSSLSSIARALEHAIASVDAHQKMGWDVTAAQTELFVAAAEDIRRLLHQFAAGFLKEPQPDLVQALRQVVCAPDSNNAPHPHIRHNPAPVEQPQTTPKTQAPHSNPALEPEQKPAQSQHTAAVPPPPAQTVPSTSTFPEKVVQDIDDDIDATDHIDADLFPIFTDEALELLPQAGAALRQWTARPDHETARLTVLRALHTLKGSARLAGALRLGEMVHRLETLAERQGSNIHHSANLEPLQAAFDAINAHFEALRHPHQIEPLVAAAPVAIEKTLTQPSYISTVEAEPILVAKGAEPTIASEAAGPASDPDMVADLPSLPGPGAGLGTTRAGAAVRVRPELLERLLNQTGEIMVTRSRMASELGGLNASLKDLTNNLSRLRLLLRDIEVQAESQMQSRQAQTRDAELAFDPLEFDRFTRVQELTRMMAESVNDIATVQLSLQHAAQSTDDGLQAQLRQTRELQRDLLRTRMVEFEGISERLYRVVRQASKEAGKLVRLDIIGGHIEIDRGVLERMTGAFEHLLRNSVVHGIELPDARLAAGKSAEGHISIRLAQENNDVSVTLEDDGAGLDLMRLRQMAKERGLLSADAQISDEAATELIFMAGLSTAQQVSELAGRGIGMDVVRTDILALGGRIQTSTQAGQGIRFQLLLPLTTAITQVVMVRAGSFTLGIPSSLVEQVRRAENSEVQRAYATGSFHLEGHALPFYWTGALLQSSIESLETQARKLPVVVVRSAAQRVAIHVDEVLGNQEVVVKNLGPQLSRLPGLAGMSMLPSGAIALVYNPVALAAVYGKRALEWVAQQKQQGHLLTPLSTPETLTNAAPMVLVVDDSITVRRVTQRLLQREGYRVTMAADGLQALERLQLERPTVVLSDIEMPHMDGFDLLRNIRSDPHLSSLPVIMITSRMAEKHREHAQHLGANHYLGKPYAESELLSLVGQYAKAAHSSI